MMVGDLLLDITIMSYHFEYKERWLASLTSTVVLHSYIFIYYGGITLIQCNLSKTI